MLAKMRIPATNLDGSLICDYFVFGLALWTLATHSTTFTGGTLRQLLVTLAVMVLLASWWRWWRRRAPALPQAAAEPRPGPMDQRDQRLQASLLWVLVLIAVVMTLVAHRPDADDDRYINRAVSVIDDPTLPILKYDTRHSVKLPETPPTTRVVSLEMLAAALAWLTMVPPIYFFHLVFPALAAMLCILAHGELFKMLAPRHWAYGVLAAMVFLVASGETHRAYGNFSFVRLHQGKGILVSVLVPLLIAYGLRFASYPTGRNWLLLAGAQVAAIGLSSTALMVGPVVASLALLTGGLGLRRSSRIERIFLGLTASAYVVGIGLYLRLFPMAEILGRYEERAPPVEPLRFLGANVEMVFGNGRFAGVSLTIILTAWLWAETGLARRLCLVFPICAAVLFANPLAADILKTHLTMNVYWRVFWILPLPVMAGITLLAPLSVQKPRLSSTARYALSVLLLLLLAGLSERHILAEANGVTIGWPGLKVPAEYQIAQAVNDAFEDRPNVLVPESVSVWLTTMHDHPYPVLSRWIHAYQFGSQGHERARLMRYLTGQARPDRAAHFFREALRRYQIEGVGVPRSNPWAEEIRDVLEQSGLEKRQTLLEHEIWVRKAHPLDGIGVGTGSGMRWATISRAVPPRYGGRPPGEGPGREPRGSGRAR